MVTTMYSNNYFNTVKTGNILKHNLPPTGITFTTMQILEILEKFVEDFSLLPWSAQ